MKSYKHTIAGALVYHENLGVGIVLESFKIKKGRPQMLNILFGDTPTSCWDSPSIKVLRLLEKEGDQNEHVLTFTYDS